MQQNIAVEMNIPHNLKSEPIIYNICKEFNVVPTISEVSFSTDVGWAFMTIRGEESELEKLFEYLKNQGITYKVRAAH